MSKNRHLITGLSFAAIILLGSMTAGIAYACQLPPTQNTQNDPSSVSQKPTATHTPTTTEEAKPSDTPTLTPTNTDTNDGSVQPTSTPTQAQTQTGTTIKVSVTFYGFPDNDDGSGHYGTAIIAYPKSDKFPTLHNQATEGTGTYNDPITFAAYTKDTQGSASRFPPGTRIYVTYLHKYFILEDSCRDCNEQTYGQAFHIDLWLGPSIPTSADSKSTILACENKLTAETATIVINPSNDYPVSTNPLYQSGKCGAKLF